MNRPRLVPALVLAACLLSVAVPGARAQAPAKTLRVDIPVVEVTGRPGATSTDRVQVFNDGPGDAEVNILVTDVGGNSRGEPVAVPRGLGQENSAADWVTVKPSSVTISSRASSLIDISIKVPVGTKAGGYYAAITFAPDDRTPPEQRASHVLLIKIAGAAAVARGRLSEVSMPGISLGGTVRFDLRLENTGTIHAIGSGRIAIRDQFGNLLTRLSIPSVVVLPGLERALSLTWDSPPIAARLRATAEVTFGTGTPVRQTATGFALMWWLAALTLAVLMLLLVAILRLTGVISSAGRRRSMPSAMPAEAVRAAPPLTPAPRPVRPQPPKKPEDEKGKKPRIQPPPAPGPAMTRPPVVAGPVTASPRPDPSFWGPQESDELTPPAAEAPVAPEVEVPERPEPPIVVPEVPRGGPVVVGAPQKDEAAKEKDEPEESPLAALVFDEEEPEEETAKADEAEAEEAEPESLILEDEGERPAGPAPSRPIAVTRSARAVPVVPTPAESDVELVDLDLEEEAEAEEPVEIFEEEAEPEEPWFEEPEELEEEPEVEEFPQLPEPEEEPEVPAAEELEEEPEPEEEPAEPAARAPLPETPLRPAARGKRPVRVTKLPPVRPRQPVPVARVESPPEPAAEVPTTGGSAMALRRAEVALRMITGKPGETGAILDAGLDLLYTVRTDRAVVARVESEFRETRNKRKLGPLSLALFAVQSPGAPRALLEAYGTAAKVIADRIRRAILACDPSDIRRHRSVIEGMPAARRASLGL